MRLYYHLIKATVIASLLGLSAVAFASTSPFTGTQLSEPFISATANSAGNLLGSTATTNSSGTTTYNYYSTGPNGSPANSLGNSIVDQYGSPNAGTGAFNVFSLSQPMEYAAGPSSNGEYPSATFVTMTATATVSNTFDSPQIMNFVGSTTTGQIAANLNFGYNQGPFYDNTGATLNGSNITFFPMATVTGVNATGAVAFDQLPSIGNNNSWQAKNMFYFSGGLLNSISDMGYGGITGGINSIGEVTGAVFTGTKLGPLSQDGLNGNNLQGIGEAFKTGSNGSGTQVFGTANGVSSYGTVINSSGQVGGYIALGSGQSEAFLSTAHGGLLVGLGAGAASDSTAVAFLNDNGQAIVYDSTTGAYYLYSAGVIVPVSSLTNGNTSAVIGFNNSGDIFLQDPYVYTPTSSSSLSASTLSTVSGAVSLTSTSTFQAVSTAQGGAAPSSLFYTDPSASTSTISLTSLSSPTGVSSPGTAGLLVLMLGSLLLRRDLAQRNKVQRNKLA